MKLDNNRIFSYLCNVNYPLKRNVYIFYDDDSVVNTEICKIMTKKKINKMDSKELQKLTDANKGNTKALEKYTSIIDQQNQTIDALTMAISELKTTIKGNPND